MGLQVQDAKLGIDLSAAPQEDVTEVDHEERQIGGIGHGDFFDVHKIIQAPILLGVAEVELDLETERIEIHNSFIGQFQIGTEQNHVRLGLGRKIGFQEDHHIEWKSKFLIEQGRLIGLTLAGFFLSGLFFSPIGFTIWATWIG